MIGILDLLQIVGMDSTHLTTSEIVIIEIPELEDVDVDYALAQRSIDHDTNTLYWYSAETSHLALDRLQSVKA